jgi:hypothetical protein
MQLLYSTMELSAHMGLSRRRLVQLLRQNEVAVHRINRTVFVPLSEIERKLPMVWDGIVLAEAQEKANPTT